MFKVKENYSEYEYKSLRLPKEIIAQVQALANDHNTSFNNIVLQCIEYALSDMERDPDDN